MEEFKAFYINARDQPDWDALVENRVRYSLNEYYVTRVFQCIVARNPTLEGDVVFRDKIEIYVRLCLMVFSGPFLGTYGVPKAEVVSHINVKLSRLDLRSLSWSWPSGPTL